MRSRRMRRPHRRSARAGAGDSCARARAPERRDSAACRHWPAGCRDCAAARALSATASPAARPRLTAASAALSDRAQLTRASAGGRGLRADLQIIDAVQRRAGDLRDAAAEVVVIQLARGAGRSIASAAERSRVRLSAVTAAPQRAPPGAAVELRLAPSPTSSRRGAADASWLHEAAASRQRGRRSPRARAARASGRAGRGRRPAPRVRARRARRRRSPGNHCAARPPGG